MQRGDEGDRPARDGVEDLVPGVALALARRLGLAGRAGQRFTQIEAGAKMLAVAMQYADIGFLARAVHGGAQLVDDGLVDRVSLVGAIQSDQCDRAIEFIGDEIVAHEGNSLKGSGGATGRARACCSWRRSSKSSFACSRPFR